MIGNYLIIAMRNLFKHKVFSFINVFGLALGMAACLLILQYARFELSYDQFEPHAGRIFRMEQDRYNQGKLSTQWAAGAAGIGLAMKQSFPEVQSFAKLQGTGGVITCKEREFRETNMYFSNDEFLPMFGYKALAGKSAGALKEINTAVLNETTARKYFGKENPIGKIIRIGNNQNYTITAVVADPPPNTHLKFNVLFSMANLLKMAGPELETTFDWDGFLTYVLLKPGTDPRALEKKLPALVREHYGKQMKERGEGLVYTLQPLQSIHLYSHYMFETEANGDGRAVYFLLAIAGFIIIIAWINYINLSTARSIDRAREVGIRKVLGSYRIQLISQFLFESFLINLMAVILAFLLILAFLPLFNIITGKEIHFSLFTDPRFWIALTILFLAGSILAGVYPAFVLSSFRPIAVLKGKLAKTGHGALLRQSLVIMQFAASVILMVGTFAVYRQLHFMQKQDLGIQINQTLVLKGPDITDSTYMDKLNAFKTEMLRQPGVTQMAASTEVPGSKVAWNAGGIKLVNQDETKSQQYRVIGIDYDFLNAYGLKLIRGRNFSRDFGTDPGAVLFNEAAAKLLGFDKPEDALDKRIDFWGKQYTIIGVVSNHHQESLRQNYDAHIFRLIPDARNYYSLKLSSNRGTWQTTIETAKNTWAGFFPGNPFEYFFLDDHFAEQYEADRKFGNTFGLFAILAIVVSCLGLLGLASFVTTQRTKEIGIRKISGAGIPSILLLLTRDFIRPVMVSFLLAVPLTWWLLRRWLENYAYTISIDAWLFILPGILILLIALITISSQTYRAASASPVKSLRTE